jgi:hypothetical protein
MAKKLIKPFAKPGYTMVNNAILDHIMPDLSGSGWKILCVAIRQTIGWVDEETDSGRRESDRISYSQFMDKSGIRGRSTVSRAIQECMNKGYLLRHPSADHDQSFDYSLNQEFEMEIETGPVSGLVTIETGPETGLVTPQKPVQKLDTQKKGVKQRDRKKRGAGAQKYQQYIQH